MKKITVGLLLLAFIAIVLPVAADNNSGVGERLVITNATIEFPANEPFHVAHGWSGPVQISNWGNLGFELDVDGEPVHWDHHYVEIFRGEPSEVYKLWFYVTNFPDGMTGTHDFTGHWLLACKFAEDWGAPPCENSGGSFEIGSATLTVIFTE